MLFTCSFVVILILPLSSTILQAKAEEELQETQGQIDSLLNELSSLSQPGGRGVGSGVTKDVVDVPFSQPGGAVMSHTEMLQVRISHLCVVDHVLKALQIYQVKTCKLWPLFQAKLQQLQSQQAQLLQITQSTRSLLEQPDSTVPPEEKQRLRAALDQLQAQHQDRLQSCQVLKMKTDVYAEATAGNLNYIICPDMWYVDVLPSLQLSSILLTLSVIDFMR